MGAIPTIPGEPDGLRAAAASLDGCGGRLEGLASAVSATGSGLAGGWSGLAASAATAACTAAAQPLTVAGDGFDQLASALRRFASELEDAQREAERAQAQLEVAKAAATTASGLLVQMSAELDPDPTGLAHLQGRLDAANGEADAATTAGAAAYQRAKAAARAAAAAFEGVAGAAPAPPPPPPPPPAEPKDEPGWFERTASGAWDGMKDGAGAVAGVAKDGWKLASETGPQWLPGSPAFTTDVLEGAGGVVLGTGQFLVQGTKATSPLYGAIDPSGQQQAQQQFKDGFAYAKEHPWETTKQVLGVHHLENGEPGKLAGEAGLTVLLTIGTAGAGAGVKATSATARLSRAAPDPPPVRPSPGGAAPGAARTPRGDILVRRWTPIDEPGPLSDHFVSTFRSGTYDEVVVSEPRRFFRDFQEDRKEFGPFWNEEPSSGPMSAMLDNAILPEWGNNATRQVEIEVPAGTTVYEGPSAPQGIPSNPSNGMPGGRKQVVILDVPSDWKVGP